MTRHRSSTKVFTLIGLALCAAGTLAPAIAWNVHWALAWLGAVNLVVLVFYGWDKLAAKVSWTRVPERVLHGFTFAGGTPMAFIAQRVFRHKTVKRSFRSVFWTLTILQIAAIGWAIWYFELWKRG